MTTSLQLPDVPFTWSQVTSLGVSRRQLTDLIESRRVRRVLHGVYQRADIPDTLRNRCIAAGLVISPFAVICDRTAAWVHDVDTFEYAELEMLPPLETYVLRGKHRVERAGCVGGERDLRTCDVEVIDAAHVTTPLRTALDLACRLGRRDALAALDGFMRRHGLTRQQMDGLLPRYRRRRGVVQARELVPLADPRSESPGESWTRMEIIDAGLPIPELQYWVYRDARPYNRLDMAYPRSRVAVEYDGRDFHSSDEQRAHDRHRRAWLERQGWTLIVVDKDSFTNERLFLWLAEVRAALRAASRGPSYRVI